MVDNKISVIVHKMSVFYTLSNHIADHFALIRISWWQPHNFAMRRVSFIITLGIQRHVYKTNFIKHFFEMLLYPVYMEFSEFSFRDICEPNKTPYFIQLL